MVVADFQRDVEVGAQESGSEFRYQLLAGVAFIPEFLAPEVAGKALFVPSPVGQLVQRGRVIALLVLEGLEGRKLDNIADGRIKAILPPCWMVAPVAVMKRSAFSMRSDNGSGFSGRA